MKEWMDHNKILDMKNEWTDRSERWWNQKE